MSHVEHRRRAEGAAVRCAVVTVSDTRTEATDESGRIMKERLLAAGHLIDAYLLVPDEPDRIRALLTRLPGEGVEAILLNGGTGISRRDRTFDAVSALLERTLPGFGELFRMLSYQEIGAAAMLSRAVAGVAGGALVFSTPGSPHAVALAMDRLILPELAHLVWELRR